MNKHIDQLYQIAQKKNRIIIGLMSGTSLDGLDIALCKMEGSGKHTKVQLQQFISMPYDEACKQKVRAVFSKEQINLQQLTLLHKWMGCLHADLINEALSKWKLNSGDIDIIASHGQSIYHAPLQLHGDAAMGNATLQIADADQIAVRTGIITLSDFRQKHIAAGGEGAPLAAYGDYLLFKEDDWDVVLLNIGGISNFTWLPRQKRDIFSTDIGPGNTLMDAWMQQQFDGRHYDKDAAVALTGSMQPQLLTALKQHPFFSAPFPKTTGPELFNRAFIDAAIHASGVDAYSPQDVMATLNYLTAVTIAEAIQTLNLDAFKLYVSGGGIHNPLLMETLQLLLPGARFCPTMEKGIAPDAKEAVLFAILANETLAGNAAESFTHSGKNFPAINMGKISLPQ